MVKYVYLFKEGKADMKMLLGGKGANLAEMTNLGLPVPSGFTITTETCDFYYKNNKQYPKELDAQIDVAIKVLESQVGMRFNDQKSPLLVSVRSGAAASMPGMMDTILNLGMNDQTVEAVAKKTNNPRFAYDSYRRFIQMFSDVVLGVDLDKFEHLLETKKQTKGKKFDTELTADDLKDLVKQYKALVLKEKGKPFPAEPREQLRLAINAVFGSWNNPRAITYRKLNDIKGLIGTAVNVQAMVFGNMGNTSGTGVCFTRNPSNGENKFYGEYLINAQGEDVVAGIRTPEPISRLEKDMPVIYKQLLEVRKKLEIHYKDMQDIEFTVQEGKLYILQTRNGKRTGLAAVKIAVELVKEKLLTEEEAIMKVDPQQLNQLLHKRLDPIAKQKTKAVGKGLPASPGAAVGKVVFNAETAEEWTDKGEKVVLVRLETCPDDIKGMHVSQGILTARGGMTSHAAVVARGMGKCCIAGCSELVINEKNKLATIAGVSFKEGDMITLDGTTGEFFKGPMAVIDPELAGEFAVLMNWAKKFKKLKVKTNADTPYDSKIAKEFGAEGTGLCRTEHMFFEGDRITPMREMILAETEQDRRKALNKLLPYQRADFEGIFKVMNNLPVIIRFLDPPLHEFLPKEEKEIQELSKKINVPVEKIKKKIEELHEFNPMLGFRGCRLGIVYPEISEMQARAVFEAAVNCAKNGIVAKPEIEIPNVIALKEFKMIKDIVQKVAKETGAQGEQFGLAQNNSNGKEQIARKVHYRIGTMIEFPRAAMIADQLATEAEFMSFGTNDLTQTTLGFSRDDAGRFIPSYVEKNIFEKDPFQTLDQEGVGSVMKLTVSKARSTKPNIEIGICGEHGGDPASVDFCHRIGLTEVSCSPYRVPIAILAAAQANIQSKKLEKKLENKLVPVVNSAKQKEHQQGRDKLYLQIQKQNAPKIDTSKAVSIRDEIRAIVKQELSALKNQNSDVRKTILVPNKTIQNNQQKQTQQQKTIVQNKPIQKIVQQPKTQQNNQKQIQTQNKPVQNVQKPNPNVIRITSVEQLAAHLQNAINKQIQQRQQMLRSVQQNTAQKNNVQIKIVPQPKPAQNQNKPQQKSVVQNKSQQVQQKVVVQNKPQQKSNVKVTPNAIRPVQQQSKPASPAQDNDPGARILPGNKRGESKNNPMLQQQATDILSKIALFKKPAQNNQQKK
ncbi:Phosphoenolpyruvate synthase [uncultured archaeon]|nr:Phosphoenolpyruvate synthase [uncultured archaeon]